MAENNSGILGTIHGMATNVAKKVASTAKGILEGKEEKKKNTGIPIAGEHAGVNSNISHVLSALHPAINQNLANRGLTIEHAPAKGEQVNKSMGIQNMYMTPKNGRIIRDKNKIRFEHGHINDARQQIIKSILPDLFTFQGTNYLSNFQKSPHFNDLVRHLVDGNKQGLDKNPIYRAIVQKHIGELNSANQNKVK